MHIYLADKYTFYKINYIPIGHSSHVQTELPGFLWTSFSAFSLQGSAQALFYLSSLTKILLTYVNLFWFPRHIALPSSHHKYNEVLFK